MAARHQNNIHRPFAANLALTAHADVLVSLETFLLEVANEVLQWLSRLHQSETPSAIIFIFLEDLVVEFQLVLADGKDSPMLLLQVLRKFVETARRSLDAEDPRAVGSISADIRVLFAAVLTNSERHVCLSLRKRHAQTFDARLPEGRRRADTYRWEVLQISERILQSAHRTKMRSNCAGHVLGEGRDGHDHPDKHALLVTLPLRDTKCGHWRSCASMLDQELNRLRGLVERHRTENVASIPCDRRCASSEELLVGQPRRTKVTLDYEQNRAPES